MLQENSWLVKYNKLNNSFKKKLVFRLGAEAGFFSEYNHMVFAMLYCLKHSIKFVLSTRGNKFDIKNGWQDFFLPFCEETKLKFHITYNIRKYQYRKARSQDYKTFVFKKVHGINFFTQDIWDDIRAQNPGEIFCIPELGINHTLVGSCKIIIDNIWRYQPGIAEDILNKVDILCLPKEYIGIHIRGGDKVTEHQLFTPTDYIEKLITFTQCKDIYVATDDYRNIIYIKENFSNYNVYTNCSKEAIGHLQSTFDAQNISSKKEALIDLFTDVDILSNAGMFIGTYSSNIGMYIGMRIGESKCKCLDFDKWQLW
jgi:hypothetical protein